MRHHRSDRRASRFSPELIINFPGNPETIPQIGKEIEQALPHAIELITGRRSPH